MSEEAEVELNEAVLDFLRTRYGVVESQDIGPRFFLCWTEKADPEKITRGDKFFYFFLGKLFLSVEVPCGFADEIDVEDILPRDIFGKGRRGSAYVMKNTIPNVVVEEFPHIAEVTIDLMVRYARELEASYSGEEVPENLFPLRIIEQSESEQEWIEDSRRGGFNDGLADHLGL